MFMGPCIVSTFQYTCISNKMQRYTVYLYMETALHVSGVLLPFIRSAYNCIYSIWYLSHCHCYLPQSWKSWNRFECAVGGVRHSTFKPVPTLPGIPVGARFSAPVPTVPVIQLPVLWLPGLFPRGKAAVAWPRPPTPSSAEVYVKVELYLCSPSGPSLPVLGWTKWGGRRDAYRSRMRWNCIEKCNQKPERKHCSWQDRLHVNLRGISKDLTYCATCFSFRKPTCTTKVPGGCVTLVI
jgi:hypothetical protein